MGANVLERTVEIIDEDKTLVIAFVSVGALSRQPS
jgi:hypothetical protein